MCSDLLRELQMFLDKKSDQPVMSLKATFSAIRLCEDKNVNHVWTCLIATTVADLETLIIRSRNCLGP